MALLTTIPIIMTAPSIPTIESDNPASQIATYIPTNPSGTVNMIRNGRDHDSMIAAISR